MKLIFLSFLGALCTSAYLTPVTMRQAIRFGVVDQPDARRVHVLPIPRLGGVAIACAFWLFVAVGFVLDTPLRAFVTERPSRFYGFLIGSIVIMLVGAFDDAKGVRAKYKLGWQIVVAAIAYGSGLRIDAVTLPGFGTVNMGYFSGFVTIFWIVGVINAINLIDGLDGLAGGIVFFASVSSLIVSYIQGADGLSMISAALAGATLGFLIFNFHPAKVFMGDSGSMFLGFTLASMSMMGTAIKSSTTIAILVPLVALGVPILDTLFAIVRRFLERRPIFSPDRGHIHHVLLDLGLTQRRAVMILYSISIALTFLAIFAAMGHDAEVGSALFILSAVVFVFFRSTAVNQNRIQRWQAARKKSNIIQPAPAPTFTIREAPPTRNGAAKSNGHTITINPPS